MKKIKRITDVYDYGDCVVKKSDLDELEQENKLFYENWQTFVAIANEQRIARVAIRQQRDELEAEIKELRQDLPKVVYFPPLTGEEYEKD